MRLSRPTLRSVPGVKKRLRIDSLHPPAGRVGREERTAGEGRLRGTNGRSVSEASDRWHPHPPRRLVPRLRPSPKARASPSTLPEGSCLAFDPPRGRVKRFGMACDRIWRRRSTLSHRRRLSLRERASFRGAKGDHPRRVRYRQEAGRDVERSSRRKMSQPPACERLRERIRERIPRFSGAARLLPSRSTRRFFGSAGAAPSRIHRTHKLTRREQAGSTDVDFTRRPTRRPVPGRVERRVIP